MCTLKTFTGYVISKNDETFMDFYEALSRKYNAELPVNISTLGRNYNAMGVAFLRKIRSMAFENIFKNGLNVNGKIYCFSSYTCDKIIYDKDYVDVLPDDIYDALYLDEKPKVKNYVLCYINPYTETKIFVNTDTDKIEDILLESMDRWSDYNEIEEISKEFVIEGCKAIYDNSDEDWYNIVKGGGNSRGPKGKAPPRRLVNGKVEELHHYITNKHSVYSPKFLRILNRYKLSLKDEWNKKILPHRGRHAHAYHNWMVKRVAKIDEIAKGDSELFLELFEDVKETVNLNPDMLYSAYWKSNPGGPQ